MISLLYDILSFVEQIKNWFYDAYHEVASWISPFNSLAVPLYNIYNTLYYLHNQFFDFIFMLDIFQARVWEAIGTIVSEETILFYINLLMEKIYEIRAWIDNAPELIRQIADSLWQSWTALILELRDAWYAFRGKIPSIDRIIAWFLNWWANILSPLTSWWNERLLDIERWISDIIAEWFPFYDTLVQLWDSIVEFFVDPLQWLYDQLDNFFERFW